MCSKITYKPFGSKAILLEWPSKIDELILEEITAMQHQVIAQKKQVIDSIVGYHSLTLLYKTPIDFNAELIQLKKLHQNISLQKKKNKSIWQIPVCYDTAFGMDLKVVAQKNNLSIQEIIELHTQDMYTVYFIGFLPGFPYLGGLDKRLFCARRAVPRLEVPKGAVGIGGAQTGIYPQASAGGWQIIGNTPVSLFDAQKSTPCKLKAGDQVQFYSISKASYFHLQEVQATGASILKKVSYD